MTGGVVFVIIGGVVVAIADGAVVVITDGVVAVIAGVDAVIVVATVVVIAAVTSVCVSDRAIVSDVVIVSDASVVIVVNAVLPDVFRGFCFAAPDRLVSRSFAAVVRFLFAAEKNKYIILKKQFNFGIFEYGGFLENRFYVTICRLQ